MFRAALVALVEALVLAETVFGGAAGASSGPAAENVALPPLPGTPTDLQLHWLSFWRHSCGYPTGEVVAHTNAVQNDTRVISHF
jgi:hypothetical protein